MKAIETEYNGYRFRSRLEARWAVFFDSLGISYEYEPEGFEFEDGTRYLPDFWLPEVRCWIEVKGPEPSEEDKQKAYKLAVGSGWPVILGHGSFRYGYDEFGPQISPLCDVFYGTPEQAFRRIRLPWPTILESRTESRLQIKSAYGHIEMGVLSLLSHLRDNGFDVSYSRTPEGLASIVSADKEYYQEKYDEPHPLWRYGWRNTGPGGGNHVSFVSYSDFAKCLDLFSCGQVDRMLAHMDDDMQAAYTAAQQARFEHGETPEPIT